jgi:hypothetical protein
MVMIHAKIIRPEAEILPKAAIRIYPFFQVEYKNHEQENTRDTYE